MLPGPRGGGFPAATPADTWLTRGGEGGQPADLGRGECVLFLCSSNAESLDRLLPPVGARRSPRKRTTSQCKSEPPLLRTSKRTIYTAGRPPWYNEHGTQSKEAFAIGERGSWAGGQGRAGPATEHPTGVATNATALPAPGSVGRRLASQLEGSAGPAAGAEREPVPGAGRTARSGPLCPLPQAWAVAAPRGRPPWPG